MRGDFRALDHAAWSALGTHPRLTPLAALEDRVLGTAAVGTAAFEGSPSGGGGGVEVSFNVYLFDGPHERADHYDALVVLLPRLDTTFVYLVDDWNYAPVQAGTFEAYAALGLEVLFEEVLGGNRDHAVPGPWHCGFYVAVLRQTR